MQDVLTQPVTKRDEIRSVITPQTREPAEKPVQRLPESVICTNGSSPNGDTFHVKNEPKSDCPKDPTPYGWRYITTTTEEGKVEFSRVALTAYDLLHPQEGDVIMHKPPHEKGYNYLHNSLTKNFKRKPKTFVSSDLRIDLDIPETEPLVPDISVIFDVEEEKAWGTFYTQTEGTAPSAIFEITSPSTRDNDFGKKREYYAQAGVLHYIIVDIEYDPEDDNIVTGYSIYAYELVDGSYIELTSDEQGRYWIPSLEISVGANEEGVLCYDEQGQLIMSYAQLDEALAEAEKRISEESARATEQEQIARQESARAAEQERIAQEESARAEQAEEENARLRAIIEQLGGTI